MDHQIPKKQSSTVKSLTSRPGSRVSSERSNTPTDAFDSSSRPNSSLLPSRTRPASPSKDDLGTDRGSSSSKKFGSMLMRERDDMPLLEERGEKNRKCSIHEGETIILYCVECEVAVCNLCFAVHHDGHLKEFLADVTAKNRRQLKPMITVTDKTAAQLQHLLDGIDASQEKLHGYVDDQVSALQRSLERKRDSLHDDAEQRATAMRSMIAAEMERCEKELQRIDEAQCVLKCLANGEGVVDGDLGELILGKMPYAQFEEVIHAPLHDAERMLSLQGLQLPVQDLQLMCDLVDWTPASMHNAAQLFP